MSDSTQFIRDRLTWLAYSMLGYLGLMQALLGPILPGLARDLHLDYTQSSLISTAVALGMILAGMATGSLAKHFTRAQLLWGSAVGITGTVALLAFAHSYNFILFAFLGMGAVGTITQVMVQAILSDRHGEQRPVALSEANVAASLFGMATPLAISTMQKAGLDWRSTWMLFSPVLVLILLAFRGQVIPTKIAPMVVTKEAPQSHNKMPTAFWGHLLVLLFIVSTEMSLGVWTASFLIAKFGMEQAAAVLAFSLYPASQVLARFAGSQLARRFSASHLQTASFIIAIIGAPLLWLAPTIPLSLVGLFIAGVGVANLFPLTMSTAVGVARYLPDVASARISMVVGLALLTAPFVLGRLADAFTLANAFGIVLVLLFIGLSIKLVLAATNKNTTVQVQE